MGVNRNNFQTNYRTHRLSHVLSEVSAIRAAQLAANHPGSGRSTRRRRVRNTKHRPRRATGVVQGSARFSTDPPRAAIVVSTAPIGGTATRPLPLQEVVLNCAMVDAVQQPATPPPVLSNDSSLKENRDPSPLVGGGDLLNSAFCETPRSRLRTDISPQAAAPAPNTTTSDLQVDSPRTKYVPPTKDEAAPTPQPEVFIELLSDDEDILEVLEKRPIVPVIVISDDEEELKTTPGTVRKSSKEQQTATPIASSKKLLQPKNILKKNPTASVKKTSQGPCVKKTTPQSGARRPNPGASASTVSRGNRNAIPRLAAPAPTPRSNAVATNQRLNSTARNAPRGTSDIITLAQHGPSPSFNLDNARRHLDMAVVNNAQPSGEIPPYHQNLLVTVLTKDMFERSLNGQHAPRFVSAGWSNGHFLVECFDVATRKLLIESVMELPPLWPGCALAAVRCGTNSYKRVQLLLGSQQPSYNEFMRMLAVQNPDLNVCEWRYDDCKLQSHGAYLVTLRIDNESFEKIQRNQGYVFYGFGRLLLHMIAHQSLYSNTAFYNRMVECNLLRQQPSA